MTIDQNEEKSTHTIMITFRVKLMSFSGYAMLEGLYESGYAMLEGL
jgi:hypothetical protein